MKRFDTSIPCEGMMKKERMKKMIFLLLLFSGTMSVNAQLNDQTPTSVYDKYVEKLKSEVNSFNSSLGEHSPELDWARYSSWQEQKATRSRVTATILGIAASSQCVASVYSKNNGVNQYYRRHHSALFGTFAAMFGAATVSLTIKGRVESSKARKSRYVHDFR